MRIGGKILSSLWLVASVVLLSTQVLCAQTKIRVQGIVYSLDSEQPITRASITIDDVFIAYSDEGGKFSISVAPDAVLEFNKTEYETERVALNGEQELSVKLKPKVVEIGEVVVMGKDLSNKVLAEPTDIEIRGNYFHIKTRFSIPHRLFRTDDRFVVQPTVVDLTEGKQHHLRPVVIDGRHYDLIEYRSMHFGQTADELERYVVPNEITKANHILPYKDSLYIPSKEVNNSFQADCVLAIASYHEPAKFLDTVTIANGTINPLRFFDTSTKGLSLDESQFVPAPELELHNSKGVADIEFEIGKSTINYNNPKNERNIEQIQEIIRAVLSDEYATLRSIDMEGYASPDGTYHINQRLADLRTAELMKIVSSAIDEANMKFVKLTTKGVVEKWSKVAEIMTEDKSPVAESVAQIVEATKDNFVTTQARIRQMPEYRSIISPVYLPRLRRVEYEVDYSVFRPLTIDEIRTKYNDEAEQLSRYEYYKLIEAEPQEELKLEYERSAIRLYPNFTIYVNREALRLIAIDSVNLDLLQPLLADTDVPDEVRYNQAIMAIKNHDIDMADSLLQKIRVTSRTLFLKNAVDVLKGNYERQYQYFKRLGGLNEVLVLLCLKRDEEAFAKMKILMQDRELAERATYCYVLAICANRNIDLNTAMVYLQVALDKDPSLVEIAKIDSDILDIYELIRIDKEVSSE